MTKTCTRCHEELDLEEFYADASAKDGRQSRCMECTKEASLDRYYSGRTGGLPKRLMLPPETWRPLLKEREE